jgi:hypothetical protein
MRVTVLAVLLLNVFLTTAALADVPGRISYQGTLTDAGGVALDTTVSMTFTIFSDSAGSHREWDETQPAVEISAGLFNVLLGSVNPISENIFPGARRWLGIEVGGDPQMSPLQELVSVGYAFHAAESDTADYARSAPAASDGDWTISGSDIYSAVAGNVGIGTASPGFKLTVDGHLSLSDATSIFFLYDGSSNRGGLDVEGSNKLRIGGGFGTVFTNGDVGIGTSSPAAELDVKGDINANSLYKIGEITVLSTEGDRNFLAGPHAGVVNTGHRNTFVGDSAGVANTSGWRNTFVGYRAGESHTTGYNNTFVGVQAGAATTTSISNTCIGSEAGRLNTGEKGTFLGMSAGINNQGNSNSFLGYSAGFSNTTGARNLFAGETAGFSNTIGSNNTFLGSSAGENNTEGDGNTFVGARAGVENTTGIRNTCLGEYAGRFNQTGSGNVFIGHQAGYNELNSNKLYIANGPDTSDVVIYGDFSTGRVGIGTLDPGSELDVDGDINANGTLHLNGFSVLRRSSTNNLMVGRGAGENNTGNNNTFVGDSTGVNTQDSFNTFVGSFTGTNTTTGEYNTFLGMAAGHANTTGDFNTFIGPRAGGFNTDGFSNVCLGYHAGRFLSTGDFNVCLGNNAGYNNITGNSNVFIGSQAGYNETGSDKLYIANGPDTSDVVIYGDFSTGRVGIGTTNPAKKLQVIGETDISSATDTRALNVTSALYASSGQMINFETLLGVTAGNDMLQIKANTLSDNDCQFIECERGSDVEFRVWGDGDVTADGTISGGGADFAEMMAVSAGATTVQPGDVLVIDPRNPQSAVKSSKPQSTLVAGIYSTKPGFLASERDWDRPGREDEEVAPYSLEDVATQFNEVPLAVVGIVPCKVSAENGAINPGDLLVTSATPGHAMRDEDPKTGTVVGKALESLPAGTGLIKVLVTLQ